MSHVAMVWAVDQRPSNATDKLVLLALANYAAKADGGICWPGQDTIADFAICSVDTVQRALKRLAAGGYIRIEKATDSNGQRLYDRYRLLFDVVTTAPDGQQKRHAANCGVADVKPPSHAKTAEPEADDEAADSHTANCGVDPESHAANHTANHTANHAANHAANCGPNLREPLEPKEPPPQTPAAVPAAVVEPSGGGGDLFGRLHKGWTGDAIDAIRHLQASPTNGHVIAALAPALALFGPPLGQDPASYIRQLTRLGVHRPAVLADVAGWVIETRIRDWPAVADLVAQAKQRSAVATGTLNRAKPTAPAIELTAADGAAWCAWIGHIHATAGAQQAAAVEATGRLLATGRWPNAGVILLQPRLEQSP